MADIDRRTSLQEQNHFVRVPPPGADLSKTDATVSRDHERRGHGGFDKALWHLARHAECRNL